MTASLAGAGAALDAVGGRLAVASIEGAVLVAVAWIGLSLLPRLHPAWRAAIWWLICLRLLAGLAGVPRIEVPAWPVAPRAAVRPAPAGVAAPVSGPASAPGRPTWARLLVTCWAAGVLVHGVAMARRAAAARRLVRRARAVTDPEALALAAEVARELGLRRRPRLAVSVEVSSPLVAGALRPTIVLPRGEVTRGRCGDLRLILAHEMAHLHRRDAWLSLVPAAAQALYSSSATPPPAAAEPSPAPAPPTRRGRHVR
jgi:beta-lactamase regulating signal transducer with metallopeptidase domain